MIFIQYYVRIVLESRRSIFRHFYRHFHNRIGKPLARSHVHGIKTQRKPLKCKQALIRTHTRDAVSKRKRSTRQNETERQQILFQQQKIASINKIITDKCLVLINNW
jgi:hypothetical protein